MSKKDEKSSFLDVLLRSLQTHNLVKLENEDESRTGLDLQLTTGIVK